jgi:hypothetical protein
MSTWNLTMNTPIGTQKFSVDIEGGSMTSQAGASKLENVKVDGNAVAFSSTVNSPMGAVALAFSGTINANQISGTCKTMFGDMEFSGEKA